MFLISSAFSSATAVLTLAGLTFNLLAVAPPEPYDLLIQASIDAEMNTAAGKLMASQRTLFQRHPISTVDGARCDFMGFSPTQSGEPITNLRGLLLRH